MIIDLKKEPMSLSEAIFIAKENDVIYLDNKDYYEKIVLEKPYITIKGRGNSKITFDAYAGKLNPATNKNYGTTGSATLTLKDSAHHTKLINLIIENSYIKTNEIPGEQAVAYKSEASNIYIEECKFLSFQDTFYVDYGTDNLVINSHIEGDVDFIFGSADCVFKGCTISSKSLTDKGYYTAPDTYTMNTHGLVFKDCLFNQLNEMKTYIGRGWYPGGALSPVIPRASFIDSTFLGDIEFIMLAMRDTDPDIDILSIKGCKYNGNKIEDFGDSEELYVEEVLKKYNVI